MRKSIKQCNSQLADEEADIFNYSDWDLGDEILSEGTKTQTTKYSQKQQNMLKNTSFATTRRFHEINKSNMISNDNFELSWFRHGDKLRKCNAKETMYKIALLKSANNAPRQIINDSNSSEESKASSTLKEEIKRLLRKLSERRSTLIKNQSSISRKCNSVRARDWASSNIDFCWLIRLFIKVETKNTNKNY